MGVIARSQEISVETNVEYSLDSFFSSIYPCPQNDIKTITLKRPKCAPLSDKIRAYGQGNPKPKYFNHDSMKIEARYLYSS